MCSNATRATDPRQMLNSVQGSRTVLFVCSVSLDVWRNASATWNTVHMVLACSTDIVRPVEVAFDMGWCVGQKCGQGGQHGVGMRAPFPPLVIM